MATKPVKNFLNTMAGAPVLSGTAGSLIAVLDACLVNGFNLITLDSLVVSGNVLTGTKAGHGFVVDQVVATSANEDTLTGEWTVTSVTSNTFIASATGVANVTGTGALTAKAAPAGWEKVYSGTNKAAYRSLDVTSTKMLLRIDDTGTTTARVIGYETMADVDNGSGQFPTGAQASGGAYWYKASVADSSSRVWSLFASPITFYISRHHSPNTAGPAFDGFGDYVSEKSGDGYPAFLCASTSTSYTGSSSQSALCQQDGTNTVSNIWLARSYTQIGGAVTGALLSPRAASATFSGDSVSGLDYPSPVSNGLLLSSPCLKESTTNQGPVRALQMPGLFHTLQKIPLVHMDKISNVSGLSGKTLVALAAAGWVSGTPAGGRVFLDLYGPW